MSNRMIPFPGPFAEERTVMVPVTRLVLRATAGPLRGQQFKFDGGPFVIGRTPACAVSIPSQAVSRNHARIEFSNGSYWLVPEKTVNGTRVNGALVQEPTLLANRDRIVIDDSAFAVGLDEPGQDLELDEPAPPPAPRSSVPMDAAMRASYPEMPAQYPPVNPSWPTMPVPYDPNGVPYPPSGQFLAPPMVSGQYPVGVAPAPAPARSRVGLWLLAAFGLVVLVAGVVVVTVKLVQQPAPASAPAASPFVIQAPVAKPAPPPQPAPPPPAPRPAPAPAPKLTGVLAIESAEVTAEARGTIIDVVKVGAVIKHDAPIAHVKLYSANVQQALARLQTLQRKFGNSPDHEDFIEEARQDYLIASRRRETKPITASEDGSVSAVKVKPGDEVRAKQVIAQITIARITVPAAAVDGTGKQCTAELADSGRKLAGTLLSVGSTERTLELEQVPQDTAAGDLGEVRIHCTE